MKNTTAVLYSKMEEMRNKSIKQLNWNEAEIVQDNRDLLELEKRYDSLNIPYVQKRIIDDYIACILSRQERMETLIYYAGIKDGKKYYTQSVLNCGV